MGIETMYLISAGLQVASGFAQYSQQKKADKAARAAANEEARIMEEDAKREALQERIEAEKARKIQKVAFLSSGVDLEGSPLLVMEETRYKGEENAKNVIDRAKSRADLTRMQGSVKRASLIGTSADVASGLTSTYTNYATVNKQIK